MAYRKRSLGVRGLLISMLGLALLPSLLLGRISVAVAAGCEVVYSIPNQWGDGFLGDVTIKNNGVALSSWTLGWTFAGTQRITNLWSGVVSQSGPAVSVRNAAWNGAVASGGTVNFGFQGTYSGANAKPTSFTLNGVVCGGTVPPTSTVAPPTATPRTPTPTGSPTPPTATPRTPTATPRTPTPTGSPTPTIPPGDTNDDWLHTEGNQIVDSAGNPVWLTGTNWFGFNASERVFHGLWQGNLEQIIKAMTERGINMLRVPISTQLLLEWKNGQFSPPNVNTYANPELVGMNSLQIFDHFLKVSKKYGLKVLIDGHSADADNSGHFYPVWYKGTVTPELFYQSWEWLTARYKNDDTILAMDIKNEPHGKAYSETIFAKWDSSTDINNWKYACETASKRILAINPNLLVLCEGIEVYPKAGFTFSSRNELDYHSNWWGGNLRGVRDHPISLGANQDQLVYSPHDYGPSVFQQPWFYPGFTKATLYADVWRDNWFFIHEQNIAPLLIGEWGGFMDGGANQRWMVAMRDFIAEKRIHHTFWCLNPNSGDTGGLLLNDWVTWDEAKYALLKPSLWADRVGKFVSLDHKVPLGNSAVGTTVTQYYQNGNPAPVSN